MTDNAPIAPASTPASAPASASGDPASSRSGTLGRVPPPPDPTLVARSRRKLLLIFACFFVPLFVATIWFQVVKATGGSVGDTSRGELITPPWPMEPFELVDSDGTAWGLDELRGHWTLLTLPGAGGCAETCRRNLYNMRQVRLALNQRMTRVERVALPATDGALGPDLIAEHPGLTVLHGDAGARTGLIGQIEAATNGPAAVPFAGIYLIDPHGNLMMRFAADLDPGNMLKDLQHLLKVSQIG